jgi:aminobenzoyl-glutamate utilization protein B
VLPRVDAHAARFGQVSRQIWENPELGFQETKSSALLQQELKANGFKVEAGVAGMPTAFTASYGSGKPVIVFLGEFDALPGLSQKETPVKSPIVEGGPGHACGHNLLGSAAALAAVAVKEEMQARGLKGTIRYYGTPAEEGGGGKIFMIHAGLFKDVDSVLTWHPGDRNSVGVRSSLAVNGGWFRFYGTAAHAAAAPDRGRSALDAVMLMGMAIEFMREHVPQETRIHYVFTKGGGAANVVPPMAEMSIMARNPSSITLDGIWERILKCAQAAALATETKYEFTQSMNYADVLPNDALAEVMARSLKKVGGYSYTPEEKTFAEAMQKANVGGTPKGPGPEETTFDKSEGSGSASTDVGDVSWVVPTAQLTTATWPLGISAHTWQAAAVTGTTIGRKGMVVAAKTLS